MDGGLLGAVLSSAEMLHSAFYGDYKVLTGQAFQRLDATNWDYPSQESEAYQVILEMAEKLGTVGIRVHVHDNHWVALFISFMLGKIFILDSLDESGFWTNLAETKTLNERSCQNSCFSAAFRV
jgi:hypothetical protein